MLSVETEKKLSNIFMKLAEGEEASIKLRQALLNIPNYHPSKIFNYLDSQHKNFIDSHDLINFLKERNIYSNEKEIQLVILFYDRNYDGFLSYGEFIYMLQNGYSESQIQNSIKERLPNDLDQVFTQLLNNEVELARELINLLDDIKLRYDFDIHALFQDVKNINYIDNYSLQNFLDKTKVSYSNFDIFNIIKRLDLNRDGKVDFCEFHFFFGFTKCGDCCHEQVMNNCKLCESKSKSSFTFNNPPENRMINNDFYDDNQNPINQRKKNLNLNMMDDNNVIGRLKELKKGKNTKSKNKYKIYNTQQVEEKNKNFPQFQYNNEIDKNKYHYVYNKNMNPKDEIYITKNQISENLFLRLSPERRYKPKTSRNKECQLSPSIMIHNIPCEKCIQNHCSLFNNSCSMICCQICHHSPCCCCTHCHVYPCTCCSICHLPECHCCQNCHFFPCKCCPQCHLPQCICCKNCKKYPCICCPNCHSVKCLCCQNCKSYPCKCCKICHSIQCKCCKSCQNFPCKCCPECHKPNCICCQKCRKYPCICCPSCHMMKCICCKNCKRYPCRCCPICQSIECICCPNCKNYPCICHNNCDDQEMNYYCHKVPLFCHPICLLDHCNFSIPQNNNIHSGLRTPNQNKFVNPQNIMRKSPNIYMNNHHINQNEESEQNEDNKNYGGNIPNEKNPMINNNINNFAQNIKKPKTIVCPLSPKNNEPVSEQFDQNEQVDNNKWNFCKNCNSFHRCPHPGCNHSHDIKTTAHNCINDINLNKNDSTFINNENNLIQSKQINKFNDDNSSQNNIQTAKFQNSNNFVSFAPNNLNLSMNYNKNNLNEINKSDLHNNAFKQMKKTNSNSKLSKKNSSMSLSPNQEETQQFVDFLSYLMEVESKIEDMKIDLAKKQDFNFEDIFRIFEVDGKGYIEPEDLKNGLKVIGLNISDYEIKLLLKRFDLQQQGLLSYTDMFDMLITFEKNLRNDIQVRTPNSCCPCNSPDVFECDTLVAIKQLIQFIIESENDINQRRFNLNSLRAKYQDVVKFLDYSKKGVINRSDLKLYLTQFNKFTTSKDCDLLFIRLDKLRRGQVGIDQIENELMLIR